MALRSAFSFCQFTAKHSARSKWTQKWNCRTLQDLSIRVIFIETFMNGQVSFYSGRAYSALVFFVTFVLNDFNLIRQTK